MDKYVTRIDSKPSTSSELKEKRIRPVNARLINGDFVNEPLRRVKERIATPNDANKKSKNISSISSISDITTTVSGENISSSVTHQRLTYNDDDSSDEDYVDDGEEDRDGYIL